MLKKISNIPDSIDSWKNKGINERKDTMVNVTISLLCEKNHRIRL